MDKDKSSAEIKDGLVKAYMKANNIKDNFLGDSSFVDFRELKPDMVSWFLVMFLTAILGVVAVSSFDSLLVKIVLGFGYFMQFFMFNWSYWNGKVKI